MLKQSNKILKLEKGILLISQPFMRDASFRRAVVLLCDYSKEEGCVGYILNKSSKLKFSELIENFPDIDSKIYFGGPVEQGTLHFIHDMGDILDNSIKIYEGVYWGGDFEKLKFLIENKLIKPHNIRFFLGYTGWSAGQLEDELEYGSWVSAPCDSNYIFNTNSRKMWQETLKNKGDIFTVISQLPDVNNSN